MSRRATRQGGRRGRRLQRRRSVRSISAKGEPMFALLAPAKPRPGRAGGRSTGAGWPPAPPWASSTVISASRSPTQRPRASQAGDSRRARPGSQAGLAARPPRGALPPEGRRLQPALQGLGFARPGGRERPRPDPRGPAGDRRQRRRGSAPLGRAPDYIRDSAPVRVDDRVNRGRYFADQITLMARLGENC